MRLSPKQLPAHSTFQDCHPACPGPPREAERLTDLSSDSALGARSRRNPGGAYLNCAVRSFPTTEASQFQWANQPLPKTTLASYQGTALAGRSEAAIRAEENV